MALRVEVLDAPLAGEVFEFPDSVRTVEIGRDPVHCQVLFPPGMTTVGRRHAGIRQEMGRYKLVTHSSNPVLIDGREPFDDEPLLAEQELRLGYDGPRIRITTASAHALPQTEAGPRQLSASQRIARQRRSLLALASAATLCVVAVAGVATWFWWSDAARSAQIAALAGRLDRPAQSASISAETLRRTARSTYLVLTIDGTGRESPVGTAWVYDRTRLATNAHVAEAYEELKAGQRLIARGTVSPYPVVDIAEVRQHPDYAAFQGVWSRFQPVRIQASGETERVEAPGAGYDVALMTVEAGKALEAPLPLASREELDALGAGDAVGFAGFPMELLAGGGVNSKEPVAQVQSGHVTAVSDYFLLPAVGGERFLIQHSLPITGGASGSPMIDADGKVVGLISGMNIVASGSQRAPNAAGVNFAQRADLLAELADGPSRDRAEKRRASWASGLATYDDPVAEIPKGLLASWVDRYGEGETPELVGERSGRVPVSADGLRYLTVLDAVFTRPGRYLCVAVSRSRANLDMAVTKGDAILEYDRQPDWYPTLDVTVGETPGDMSVMLLAPLLEDGEPRKEEPDFELKVWRLPLGGETAGSAAL